MHPLSILALDDQDEDDGVEMQEAIIVATHVVHAVEDEGMTVSVLSLNKR
jgi:hypothetical protein